MKAREQQKARTKEKIIQVARELFSEQGYEVSMRAIAGHAGLAVGTLFVHFRDKRDLLAHVLHDDLAAAAEAGLKALAADQGVLDNLIAATRPIYRYYFSNPNLSRVLLKESTFEREADENPLLRNQLLGFLGGIAAALAPRFPDNSGLSRESFFMMFFSVYFMILITHLKKDQPDPDQALAELAKHLRPLVRGYGLD